MNIHFFANNFPPLECLSCFARLSLSLKFGSAKHRQIQWFASNDLWQQSHSEIKRQNWKAKNWRKNASKFAEICFFFSDLFILIYRKESDDLYVSIEKASEFGEWKYGKIHLVSQKERKSRKIHLSGVEVSFVAPFLVSCVLVCCLMLFFLAT